MLELAVGPLDGHRAVLPVDTGYLVGGPEAKPSFLDELLARDVAITVGTDSHRPHEVADRAAFLDAFTDKWGVEPVRPPSLVE